MKPDVKFLSCGDTALAVEFGDRVDRAVSAAVVALGGRIRAAGVAGVLEVVPTFRSLLVHYDPLQTSAAGLREVLQTLLEGDHDSAQPARLWRIPVCYEAEYAPDLAAVAQATGMDPQQVVDLHTATRFHVYMLGFLPGYPYMGDLPEALRLPRRQDPRIKVPAGSVAIAQNLTAVYTYESPGGWHLIGRTPMRFFEAGRTPPALLAPGDAVCFQALGLAQYRQVEAAVDEGSYRPQAERLA